MSKKKNYTNYYSKKTYEEKNEPEVVEEIVENLQEPEVEEEVVETESEKFPEGNFEKTESKKELPDRVELTENLYIREKPKGDKVPKDELDRLIASKVIKDFDGNAIVPKGTLVDVYDMVETDDVVWYGTKFGYLMAKNKDGKEYMKAVE